MEFRRVLFRSSRLLLTGNQIRGTGSDIVETNYSSRHIASMVVEVERPRQILPGHRPRSVPIRKDNPRICRHPAYIGVPWILSTEKRSEERRVGKECRSRWSPYH